MALFKPFRGTRASLDLIEKHDGYAYFCTDDGSFHIDYVDDNGNLQRKQISEDFIKQYVNEKTGDIVESALAEAKESGEFDGKDGVSGVYVGSGDMPEGYNVQIDPDGDVVPLIANTQISEEAPTADNIKLWVDIDKENLEATTSGDLFKNYASELTWIHGERWVAPKGDTSSRTDAHRTENYIEVESGATYRIFGLFADVTNVADSMHLGVFKTDTDSWAKGFLVNSTFAKWADDKSYCDIVAPEDGTRLYLNAYYYNEDANITDNVKVYKVIDGELEKVESTEEFFETATLKFRDSNGIFQPILPTGKFSKQYQYRYKYTDENGTTQKPIVKTLPFWLYEPKNTENKKLPLVVVLHSSHVKIDSELGGSSENLDNMVQTMIYDDFPKFIYDGKFGDIPAYIVMPQTGGESNGWSSRGAEIVNLVTACKQKYYNLIGDVCLLGYSLGGTGAWELASAYPEVFQRVLSVAGGLDKGTDVSNRVSSVADILEAHSVKVWAVVGTNDTDVPEQTSIDICANISNSKCTQVNLSHAGVLKHCLTIRNKILDFLTADDLNGGASAVERLEGDGQEFYTAAPSTLSFRSTAPLDEFQDVQINGVTVDPSNYTLEEGSTIVKLKHDYLSTLDVGSYELSVVSDSKTVKGDFTVAAPELNEHGFYYNVPYSYSAEFDSMSFQFIEGAVLFLDNGTVMNVPIFDDITYSQLMKDAGNYSFSMSFIDGNVTATGNFSDDGKVFVGINSYIDPDNEFTLGQPSFNAPGFDCTINPELMAADTDYLYITDYEYNSYSIQPIVQKASYGVGKATINDKPVSSIAYKAFYNRADLASIEISNSITTINWCAFEGCTSLSTIIFNGTVSQWNALDKGGCGEGEPWNRDIPATHVHCIDGKVDMEGNIISN